MTLGADGGASGNIVAAGCHKSQQASPLAKSQLGTTILDPTSETKSFASPAIQHQGRLADGIPYVLQVSAIGTEMIKRAAERTFAVALCPVLIYPTKVCFQIASLDGTDPRITLIAGARTEHTPSHPCLKFLLDADRSPLSDLGEDQTLASFYRAVPAAGGLLVLC